MGQRFDIFISYRRKGGIKDARLVDEKLRNSGYSVSFDIDTLGRGKFTDTLNTRLKGCKDFIVIFEPSYYERFYDEHGHIQPEEVLDEDWCYLELKNALLMQKNIIPLVQKDFIFPRNLPKDVRDVAEMNAIQLTEKEFKEIFEYKVKSYLISKPRFTYRHKKSIAATITFLIIAIIASLVYFGLESQKKAEEEAKRSALKTAEAEAEAKRVRDSTERAMDSLKKASEEQMAFVTRNILDSIKAKEAERKAAAATNVATAPSKNQSQSQSQRVELYWVGNGDDTGKILFGKLSRAGLKSGGCNGNGIKVSASSKPSCMPTAMGTVKCTYAPQITITTCEGSQINKLAFGQTFSGTNKDENVARQKMQENLESANFSKWVGELQALRR